MLDRPVSGRVFFEHVIRDNLDAGRPDQVSLIFDRRVRRDTPGRFRTRVITEGVTPSLHIDYKHTAIKQYHKEGRALRTETTINDTRDFGIGKRLTNLPALREIGLSANRRLLGVQRLSHNPIRAAEAFTAVHEPIITDTGARIAGLRLGDRRAHALLQALLVFRLLPSGFLNRDLRGLLAELLGRDTITAGQMSYDLRRLRAHGLITRIPRSHRYRLTETGLHHAMLLSHIHTRLLLPGLAQLTDPDPPAPSPCAPPPATTGRASRSTHPGSRTRRMNTNLTRSCRLRRPLDASITARWGPGQATTRHAQAREIVALAATANAPELAVQGHAWGILAAVELGDRTALDAELAAYHNRAEELRQPRHRWYLLSRLAMRAILSGDYAAGERLAADGRAIAVQAGEPDAENLYLATMFPRWLDQPRDSVAYARLNSGIRSATNQRVAATLTCARLLWDAWTSDEPSSDDMHYRAALERLDDPLGAPQDLHWMFNLACLAAAAAQRGDREQAERLTAGILSPYASTGIVWAGAAAFLGSVDHWLGTLATTRGGGPSRPPLTAAHAFHQRLGSPPWIACTHSEHVRLPGSRTATNTPGKRPIPTQAATEARHPQRARRER